MHNMMERSNENTEKESPNASAHALHKAVLLITFNRLHYLKEVFAAIAKARPPRLYLASNGARESVPGEKEKVAEIRAWLLAHVDWPCAVKTRFLEKNSGGAGTGVSGAVTWFFQHEKDGIVLEDDSLPTQTFFRFCEECLDRYADDKRIWHITGVAPIDVKTADSYYFAKIMHCWGWAGWADRWLPHFTLDLHDVGDDVYARFSKRKYVQDYWRRCVEESGTIDTWDYQWTTTIVAHGGLCINPVRNLISNIGVEGTHYSEGGGVSPWQPSFELDRIVHPQEVVCNEEAVERIYRERYFIQTPAERMARRLLRLVLPQSLVGVLRRWNHRRINRKIQRLGR